MSIRNSILLGSDFTSETLFATDMNDTFNGIGSYFNGVNLGNITGNLTTMPIGSIIPWLKTLGTGSGTPQTLPTGWQECDGSNNTPNLLGTTDANKYFLRGTSGTTGGTGGNYYHYHGLQTTTSCDRAGTELFSPTSITAAVHLPKRYDVVFIIKVS